MTFQTNTLLPLALTQLWQLTFLILAVGLTVWLFCRRRPYLAYAIWMLVIAKCLTPPVWSSPTGLFSWGETKLTKPRLPTGPATTAALPRSTTAAPKAATIVVHTEPTNSPSVSKEPAALRAEQPTTSRWRVGVGQLLAAVWMCGAFVLSGIIASKGVLFHALLRRSRVPTGHNVTELMGELSRRLGFHRKVRLLVTRRPLGPGVYGLLRPKLVLPQRIVSECSQGDLERIIAHELIHIRRGDNIVGLFQLIGQIIWWFHPLVWWANRRLCRERERCCDEAVVANLGCDPGRYAQTLLDVLKHRREVRPVLMSAGIRSSEVTTRRMESIMDTRRSFYRRAPGMCWAMFAMGLLLVVPGRALTRPGEASETVSQTEAKPTKGAAAQAKTDAENPELVQSAKNLGRIMSTIHLYHDVAGHFPLAHSGFGYDRKTNEWFRHRPYLSWRVLLLPLLGEKELFGKFRLGEPWDSEHNKKLIPLMPKVYCAPGGKAGEGKTNYLGVVGPNAAFHEKQAITVIEFHDGTSNTIMLVEVPDEAAVEWTRPKDFPIDTREPAKTLTGLRKGGFLTVFADGAPQFISSDVGPKMLRCLLIRNDMDVVPHDKEFRKLVRFVSPFDKSNADDK